MLLHSCTMCCTGPLCYALHLVLCAVLYPVLKDDSMHAFNTKGKLPCIIAPSLRKTVYLTVAPSAGLRCAVLSTGP
jgi:hypothetical protein